MKTRIMAYYLSEEGYNEIGERDIDLDEYVYDKVESIEDGVKLIAENEINGSGRISEEVKREEFDNWDIIREHLVDNGEIYHVQVL